MKTFFPKTLLGLDITSRKRYCQHIEWLEAEFDRLSKENRVLRIGLVDMDKELRQLRQQITYTGVYRGEDGRIYSNKKKTS